MSEFKVAVVMGSDSDLPIMKDAIQFLEQMGISCQVYISSAHRVPHKTAQIAETAEEKGIEVIISGAGGAAHLPGVIAAFTTIPVIGVPIKTATLNGVDSLYSIVQMPPGIPVATVSINGAKNAGILAAQILALKYPVVQEKLKAFRKEMAEQVAGKDDRLQEIGVDAYLANMK
ncbi:5-(carboxyamino)imidazole ribonucleotide mutase [Dehalobacterium formicoaceticum]|uniref:N5-carboxyaminoimidazole ribonucleotide mutase n=1 Tax=Dehalobacterium formicoaceticum TaxID=51515 RepID=A0ABT1Y1J0_9FIRM|nr:5-(carboxyamino)imidazole ribonucleotide mutase [Dehalobacterium formicoaceticum]MCR6544739.1 5-(carboxyamino)imidazole ribonucleotide mutase [Dehalobacterium formicoaceticum]